MTGVRGGAEAPDRLAVPPELGTAAGPLGKPLVSDPDQLAPTREECAIVAQNGEGALNKRDRHTNLNLGPLRGGLCRFLTTLTPRPRLSSESRLAAGGRLTRMLGSICCPPCFVQRTSRFISCRSYVRLKIEWRGAHFCLFGGSTVPSHFTNESGRRAQQSAHVRIEPSQRRCTCVE